MAQFARQKFSVIEDQLELVGGDAELLPGIRTIEANGHTPGHLGLEIHSQNETLLNLADCVLHPLHLEYPKWYSKVDILPEQMIATRIRLLERVAAEKSLVLFFHFEFPSLGYVEQEGQRWSWWSM
jgi:glyoxylase-like metal-dependent hydrolase (beta-lactamase superfamily II)